MGMSLPSHWHNPVHPISERAGVFCPRSAWRRCFLILAILSLSDPFCSLSWAQSPSSSTPSAQHIAARQAYEEGIDFLRRRRVDEAVAAFRRAVGADAGFAAAWAELGLALEGLERHEEAAEALERALVLRPDYSIARYILGVACNALERWDAALGCFEEILSRHPSFVAYPEFHYQRGRALMGLHRWNDAAESMCEAVRINPNYSQAHLELARIYDKLGFAPLSEEAYRTALRLDPSLKHPADLPELEETPTLPAATATQTTLLGK